MRRLAAVFAILLLFLQPNSVDTTSRGLIGLFGDVSGAGTSIQPANAASPPAPPLPSVSLQSIFFAPPPLAGLDPHKITTLIATGDVIPARSVNYEMYIRN